MADALRRTLAELRAAGPPELFDRDPSIIKAMLVARFEEKSGRTLYPAQTEMFLIETASYALSLLGEAAQTATLQNTVVWSEGRHLEDRAANVSTFRLLAQPARCTLRFVLTMVREEAVAVPARTRAGGPGGLVMATDADLIIPPGATEGEVTATATVPGAAWNGLAPAAVSDLLDPAAWVGAVANVDEVAGGSDIEHQERFRDRAANALFKIAKTGPRKGYREHVRDVHPDIVDVEVIRPEPGVIHIYPLMSTGAPEAALKLAIAAHLDPETRRPMGDDVYVLDPEEVGFSFGMIVRTHAVIPDIEEIAQEIAVERFHIWTQSLGAKIAPSRITSLKECPVEAEGAAHGSAPKLKSWPSGVVDVEVDLEFTHLGRHQFARIDALTVAAVVVGDE